MIKHTALTFPYLKLFTCTKTPQHTHRQQRNASKRQAFQGQQREARDSATHCDDSRFPVYEMKINKCMTTLMGKQNEEKTHDTEGKAGQTTDYRLYQLQIFDKNH